MHGFGGHGFGGTHGAAHLGQIDDAIRSGHLETIFESLPRSINCVGTGAWTDLLVGLRRDGLVPEADLLEAVALAPEVTEVVPRLRTAAAIIAVLPGVLLATQMGVLALFPAFGIAVLAFEARRGWVLRDATPGLLPAQRALVSDAIDLTTYLSGDLQLTVWVRIGCALMAAAQTAAGLAIFVRATSTDLHVSGAVIAAFGMVLLAALARANRRVRDLELRRPFPSFRRPIGPRVAPAAPAVGPGGPKPEPPIRIGLPTPGRTALQVLAILVFAAVAVTPLPAAAAIAVLSGVATFVVLRAASTSVTIDDVQVHERRLLTRATTSIAEIQSARTPTEAANRRARVRPRLDLVRIDETTRTIAATGPFATPARDRSWSAASREGRIVAAAARINAARAARRGP